MIDYPQIHQPKKDLEHLHSLLLGASFELKTAKKDQSAHFHVNEQLTLFVNFYVHLAGVLIVVQSHQRHQYYHQRLIVTLSFEGFVDSDPLLTYFEDFFDLS
jgi:hypothetical protein